MRVDGGALSLGGGSPGFCLPGAAPKALWKGQEIAHSSWVSPVAGPLGGWPTTSQHALLTWTAPCTSSSPALGPPCQAHQTPSCTQMPQLESVTQHFIRYITLKKKKGAFKKTILLDHSFTPGNGEQCSFTNPLNACFT